MSVHYYSICRIFALLVTVVFAFTGQIGAQPLIAHVETYGLRSVSRSKVLNAAGLRDGAKLPKSKSEIEERIEAIDGVLAAQVEAWCCTGGRPILYIGIEERGAPVFEFRALSPGQEEKLPPVIVEAYGDFTAALQRAAAEGDLEEDISKGHSLMENLPARVIQERFAALAELHLDSIRAVLSGSSDAEQRAIAAYLIGYSRDKKGVVNDLQLALRDPAPGVRQNAARAIRPIALLAQDRDAGVTVRATWFVEMLNSIHLSDRLEAARNLNLIYKELTPATISHIKDRAMPALIEMARWQHLPHALPAYLLAGRAAAVDEEELMKAWSAGEREGVLRRIERPSKR